MPKGFYCFGLKKVEKKCLFWKRSCLGELSFGVNHTPLGFWHKETNARPGKKNSTMVLIRTRGENLGFPGDKKKSSVFGVWGVEEVKMEFPLSRISACWEHVSVR